MFICSGWRAKQQHQPQPSAVHRQEIYQTKPNQTITPFKLPKSATMPGSEKIDLPTEPSQLPRPKLFRRVMKTHLRPMITCAPVNLSFKNPKEKWREVCSSWSKNHDKKGPVPMVTWSNGEDWQHSHPHKCQFSNVWQIGMFHEQTWLQVANSFEKMLWFLCGRSVVHAIQELCEPAFLQSWLWKF